MNTAHIYTTDLSGPLHILIAEREPEVRSNLQRALRRPNVIVDFAEDGEEVLKTLARSTDPPALVILNATMPRKDGITTLREIRDRNLKFPVILLSGAPAASNRAEAIESGADDFLTQPVSQDELCRAVDDLLPSASPNTVLRRPVGLAGKSDPNFRLGNWIRTMEPLLNRLAASDVPVLLQGETGVGKEVLARHIHDRSLRSGRVFLKLNCAALPSELVESELFGYEKGSFTGAFKSTPGKFELANGGTILLDEIGDMDLRLQAKLLQVLQDREFHRIGARESTQVDVRVIAATHRQLDSRILQGEFREDLYYRLNVFRIQIPPLRERADEIIPLASSFLRKHQTADDPLPEIGPALKNALLRHQWPGNIRELENIMRRYLVVRSPEMIIEELQALSSRARNGERVTPSKRNSGFENPVSSEENHTDGSEVVNLDQVRQAAETDVITKALYSTQWNRKRAAVLLGVDYKALLYKMKRLGID